MVKQLLAIIIIVLLLGLGYLYFSLQQIEVKVTNFDFTGVEIRSRHSMILHEPKIKLTVQVCNPTFITMGFKVSNVKVYIENNLVAVQEGEAHGRIKAYSCTSFFITFKIVNENAFIGYLADRYIMHRQKTLIMKAEVTPDLLPIPIPVEASRKI